MDIFTDLYVIDCGEYENERIFRHYQTVREI